MKGDQAATLSSVVVYHLFGDLRRAEYLQAQWNDNLGLHVELSPTEPAEYQHAIDDKQYDRALDTLQEGLNLDGKHRDLLFQLGVVYEKQTKFDDAVALYLKALPAGMPPKLDTGSLFSPNDFDIWPGELDDNWL